MFNLTEEAFILSSLKEVVKIWSRGSGQATFSLTINDGNADLQLGFRLGQPGDDHLPQEHVNLEQYPHHHEHPEHQGHVNGGHTRKKCPSRQNRDRARAVQHQSRIRSGPAAATAADDTKQAEVVPAVVLPFSGKILPIKPVEKPSPVPVTTPSPSLIPSEAILAPPTKSSNPVGRAPGKYSDTSSVKKALFSAGHPPSTTSSNLRCYKQKEIDLWSKLFQS